MGNSLAPVGQGCPYCRNRRPGLAERGHGVTAWCCARALAASRGETIPAPTRVHPERARKRGWSYQCRTAHHDRCRGRRWDEGRDAPAPCRCGCHTEVVS